MGYWAITATVTTETKNGSVSRQIPTFYLHENVQGIVSEKHACRIAANILSPEKNQTAYITAVQL